MGEKRIDHIEYGMPYKNNVLSSGGACRVTCGGTQVLLHACYSTDLNAAWTLLERFHSYQMVAVPKAKHFEVDLFAGNGKDMWGAVSHQSMQEAICLAALRSVGVEVETTGEAPDLGEGAS